MFTLYSADQRGSPGNCSYPHRFEILEESTLKEAVSHDYVCAEYRGNCRSSENFLSSDCLAVDCDNDHTEDPSGWVTPADVMEAFPGVSFAVHYSRNHMRPKKGRAPRPKFHILFPIARVTDAVEYSAMKKAVCRIFPYFDSNALDAARFFFGTEDAKVDYWPGRTDLTQFLSDAEPDDLFSELPDGSYGSQGTIPEGQRNATLSRFAARVLKKYGDTEETRKAYDEKAALCSPLLGERELEQIWSSAMKFYERVRSEESYIAPEDYNAHLFFRPDDYSDVGQAYAFAEHCRDFVRYSPATDYIVYDGVCWQESKPRAQAAMQQFTDNQWSEAEKELKRTETLMKSTGADRIASEHGKNAPDHMNKEQKDAFFAYQEALIYRKFVKQRRDSKYLVAALHEARPMVEIDPRELDSDPFLLNTPEYTVDLRKGMDGITSHDPEDFITKCTAVDPGRDGEEIWEEALYTFFCGDAALESYVQKIVGLAVIGHVYMEALIIAHGDGRNGKSTFWNVLAKVLGSYSGNISADALTVGCKRNVKPELAETKGKRLLIAAELEEGMRLNTALVKQFCSTDEIFAEKKYKDPFAFTPSHTLVLYTNHLPKVGANDPGTWRRLIVVPFNAKIESSGDIKNYADYLFTNAGPAILTWMIEGARKVTEADFHIEQPECVRNATALYRENSDWLEHFLSECCELAENFTVQSGDLYTQYREFCRKTGEFARSTTDFCAAIELAGFERKRTKTGRFVRGLRLKSEFASLAF